MNLNLKSTVLAGAALFSTSIAAAYALSPHWLTFSHFARQWYTLIPFILAMSTCVVLLWRIGSALRRHPSLLVAGNALRASAGSAALVLCVPYAGSLTQKSVHNAIVLSFVLFAAFGFAWCASRLGRYVLHSISASLVALCVIGLVFLIRFDTHPVPSWAWVVIQLLTTALLITGLTVIADILDRKAPGPAQPAVSDGQEKSPA